MTGCNVILNTYNLTVTVNSTVTANNLQINRHYRKYELIRTAQIKNRLNRTYDLVFGLQNILVYQTNEMKNSFVFS